MGTTLEQFAADCHDVLAEDSGPDGLEQVRRRLETALQDPDFVAAHLGPDNDEPRKILHEDPELGFCIVAHVYEGPKGGAPHDHGDQWAIYGQAIGTTEMTEWRKVAAPDGEAPGKAEVDTTYELSPGMARVYGIGKLHSPLRRASTKLIRIEGANLDNVSRDAYEPV